MVKQKALNFTTLGSTPRGRTMQEKELTCPLGQAAVERYCAALRQKSRIYIRRNRMGDSALLQFALVAPTVEHIHGKNAVIGSNPI